MIEIPQGLAEAQGEYNGAAGRAFIEELPARAERFLAAWDLRPAGPSRHGVCALVLPVDRADGTPAALKLQLLDEETAGEPIALRAWAGRSSVRLLEHEPETGTLLLERLDATRPLSSLPDSRQSVRVLAELLAELTAVPAPPGLRRLGDIAADLLDAVPEAVRGLPDGPAGLLRDCAAALAEVAGEPGDRLLHWDLHEDNVLAGDRAPWLAIDPKPLVGDPGFELLPALANRFAADEVRWRFDLMTDVLDLDRERARAWTLGRVLQNCLWDLEDDEGGPDGYGAELSDRQLTIAALLL
ncbi:aminoglycoside phosphotransferase family protein [Streptomyces bambusae]|uniref:aminoglycoside phosphotransferase family protein n=1 Tax=Streptomyces bambusae TaxID=1550616 RepID=UPI001CFE98CB|nr:aminoglycoside phosphotransferase family protein [Streptomyces bambusae]MCB5166158.1 aminoglycoside phosphotransferase family protein [Streptomyces bambusae]